MSFNHSTCLPFLPVLTALLAIASSSAQIEIGTGRDPQRVFGGGKRAVGLIVSNGSPQRLETEARIVLLQTSSATAVRVAELPWKKLELLPSQTVFESAPVSFPAVKAETRFLIQWMEGTNKVFGTTEVLVYPTNLLAELKTLAGDEALGVFDPDGQLKPLLKALAVEFQDLVEDGTDKFPGKLAIFGPFASSKQIRDRLSKDIRVLARRGVAVVWLQPPAEPRAALKPSFYTVPVGNGAVVVAQGGMVSNLAERPESQMNLIRLAELALRPQPLDLPESENLN